VGIADFLPFPNRLPPGRPGDPGLFGPASMAWRVNGESVLFLGGSRALLMQIAHPAVAAGVAEHSDFPARAFDRLWRTMDAMGALSFGDEDQWRRAAASVTAVHRRVAGRTPDGRRYRALDPHLLLWVHATLVDTALEVHRRFVGGLEPSHEERYYREMRRLAVVLEVPEPVLPADLATFRSYVADTLGRVEVSEQARRLAPTIVSPPLPPVLAPLARALRAVTVALLPEPLRQAYGLRCHTGQRVGVALAGGALRATLPLVPDAVRRPYARAAERRAAAGR
jgi:uncharacterized protein (DUF2236 family)